MGIIVCKLFRLWGMLVDRLLKLVLGDEAYELSPKVSKFNCLFPKLVVAHEFQQPTFHEIQTQCLQIISNCDTLAFTCQTPLQLDPDVPYDRTVSLHYQTFKLFAVNTSGHRQLTVAHDLMVIACLLNWGLYSKVNFFGD